MRESAGTNLTTSQLDQSEQRSLTVQKVVIHRETEAVARSLARADCCTKSCSPNRLDKKERGVSQKLGTPSERGLTKAV